MFKNRICPKFEKNCKLKYVLKELTYSIIQEWFRSIINISSNETFSTLISLKNACTYSDF